MSAPLPSRWFCRMSPFFTGERMTGGPPLNQVLTCAGPVMGDMEGNGHVCETCEQFVPGTPENWKGKYQEEEQARLSDQQCQSRHGMFGTRCLLKEGHDGLHVWKNTKGRGYKFTDEACMSEEDVLSKIHQRWHGFAKPPKAKIKILTHIGRIGPPGVCVTERG